MTISEQGSSPSGRVSREWSETLLKRMRHMGDAPADDVIQTLMATTAGERELREFMHARSVNPQGIRERVEGLSKVLVDYLEETDAQLNRLADELAHESSPSPVELAQQMFATLGPEVLMILGFYSLPAAYAADKGAHVLLRTGRLTDYCKQRILETTQLIIDVLVPGALAPGQLGIVALQKVRLYHAYVRYQIRNDSEDPWDEDCLGTPINQEDMAGTLMTFSSLVLDGLVNKLRIRIPPDQQLAYVRYWGVLGRVIGVHDELIPATVEDATALMRKIQSRQIAPSMVGRRLTDALIEMYRNLFGLSLLRGVPPALIRDFLPSDVVRGLRIPHAPVTRVLLKPVLWAERYIGSSVETDANVGSVLRWLNLRIIHGLLRAERAPGRPSFNLPRHLADRWSTEHG